MIDDVTVNLIDTPGHPDFIAEVDRVLSLLDGAMLVVSAVEGVQAQTRVLMRALQRLGVPTLIFVNKIDRVGADDARVLSSISAARCRLPRLRWRLAHRSRHRVLRRSRRTARHDAAFVDDMTAAVADHDDELLGALRRRRSERSATTSFERGWRPGRSAPLVHPVFFGSAITGAGVDDLMAGITELLPATRPDDR